MSLAAAAENALGAIKDALREHAREHPDCAKNAGCVWVYFLDEAKDDLEHELALLRCQGCDDKSCLDCKGRLAGEVHTP